MDIKQAIEKRRSVYTLSAESPVTDEEIKRLVDFAVLNVPSAFNSQSARTVLLLGGEHARLWGITLDELQKKITNRENFTATREKIESCFAAGRGTVLFYEDQSVVRSLQERFPSYRDNFPVWSEHTSAMHQFAIWTLLADAGLGASLQHYNPLIDVRVAQTWGINPDWKLIAQMPFGAIAAQPGPKEFLPLEGRSLVFG